MKKMDYERVRESWIKNAEVEAGLWLRHIDSKKNSIVEIYQSGNMPIFEQGELLFNIFSYTNWLAHIDLRNAKHITEVEMVDWLKQMTSWPTEAVQAFWFCLRNPTMHIGRTFICSDYDRKSSGKLKLFGDLHPDLDFDPLAFQPDDYKPTADKDGWMADPNPVDGKKLVVTFYFAGIRRKLDFVLEIVLQNIKTADNSSLGSLSEVNRKILPFRVIGR